MEHELDIKDYSAVLADQGTKDHFMTVMNERAKEHGLFGFEVPQKLHLTCTEFTTDNEMMTPTMKQVRIKIKNHFKV